MRYCLLCTDQFTDASRWTRFCLRCQQSDRNAARRSLEYWLGGYSLREVARLLALPSTMGNDPERDPVFGGLDRPGTPEPDEPDPADLWDEYVDGLDYGSDFDYGQQFDELPDPDPESEAEWRQEVLAEVLAERAALIDLLSNLEDS